MNPKDDIIASKLLLYAVCHRSSFLIFYVVVLRTEITCRSVKTLDIRRHVSFLRC